MATKKPTAQVSDAQLIAQAGVNAKQTLKDVLAADGVTTVLLSSVQSKQYDKNTKNGIDNACLICGKEVEKESDLSVHLLTSGELTSDQDSSREDSQGFHPVGAGCAKKLPAGFVFGTTALVADPKVTNTQISQTPKNPTVMADTAKKETVSNEMVQRGDLFLVPLSKIKLLEGFNERQDYGNMDELVASVMSEGVKIPGLGFKNADGTYTLTEGHRRRLAIELAAEKGKPGILMPLYMERKGTNDADRLLGQLTNNDGKPFTMLEQARVVKRLVDMGESTAKIAKRRGVSPAAIDNLLILVSTSPQTQADVEAGVLSSSLVVDTVRASGGDVTAAEEALAAPVAQAKEEGRSVKRNEVTATIKKINVSQLHTLADQLEDEYLHAKTGDDAKDAANQAHYTTVVETLRRAHAVLNGERTVEEWNKKLPTYKRPEKAPVVAKPAKLTPEEKAAKKQQEKDEAKAKKAKEKEDAAKAKAKEKQDAATAKGATAAPAKKTAAAAKKDTPPAGKGGKKSPQEAIADLEAEDGADMGSLNDVE